MQVFASDTNVFTFLLAHRERVKCSRIFFGTDRETLVNIDEIYEIMDDKPANAVVYLPFSDLL